jgi:hypothetical protein
MDSFHFVYHFSWLSTQSGMNKSAKGKALRVEIAVWEAEWTMKAICGSSRA